MSTLRNRRLSLPTIALICGLLLAGCGQAAPAATTSTGENRAAVATEASTAPAPTSIPQAEPSATAVTAETLPAPIAVDPGAVEAYQDVVDGLIAAGLQVEPTGEGPELFFPVRPQQLMVNGQEIQVWEFPTYDETDTAAATILPSGSPATMMIKWAGLPHFYRAGRTIVLYVGEEAPLLEAFESVLGPQFAGQ